MWPTHFPPTLTTQMPPTLIEAIEMNAKLCSFNKSVLQHERIAPDKILYQHEMCVYVSETMCLLHVILQHNTHIYGLTYLVHTLIL